MPIFSGYSETLTVLLRNLQKKVRIMSNNDNTRLVKMDYIARVEGEGSFYVKLKHGEVLESKLKIFEPPRFFEGFF